jgi:hypothetical protein
MGTKNLMDAEEWGSTGSLDDSFQALPRGVAVRFLTTLFFTSCTQI